ncbi:MAG: anaerobic ribonucleoside-triphosphate reductase activating protein [Candidatus Riflebacteria bacterium]|nr:anaerobic ribonucleoside-triphosphate reductase activating protein [Candidatus Riflebacteria bacterium]
MSDLITIGGLQPFTMIDYPKKISAVVFLQGCNLRCRYCYNTSLLCSENDKSSVISFESLVSFLEKRRGFLEAVVFSGGEPCLQRGLQEAMSVIKDMGYKIGLHTNGFFADAVIEIINNNAADFIAIDFKAPFNRYQEITGYSINKEKYSYLADLLVNSEISYEYRTTVHNGILSENDLFEMADWLIAHRVENYALQEYKHGNSFDQNLPNLPGLYLSNMLYNKFDKNISNFIIRSDSDANYRELAA